jgi:ankyrin repeat protein
MTALTFAALIDSPGLVKVLVSRNADVDARDSQGRTALQIAVLNGGPKMMEVVTELIKGEADPTWLGTPNGANAIHLAVLKKDIGLLKTLLTSRCTRLQFFDHSERSTGLTALGLAKRIRFKEGVDLFERDVIIFRMQSCDEGLA